MQVFEICYPFLYIYYNKCLVKGYVKKEREFFDFQKNLILFVPVYRDLPQTKAFKASRINL